MAKQTYKKHLNKNNKSNNYKGNNSKKENVKIEAINYTEGITVGELANKINRNSGEIIKLLFMLGKVLTINSPLDDENVELICMEWGITPTKIDEEEEESLADDVADDPKDLRERAPIVTIMGHVDHGKTSILDAFRKSNVVSGEFGGITQHIGAYQVDVNGKKITFLDTPGHEAFTAMRQRGASVTDVSIIVVAADDGVMPQTIEAIDHSKAAKVPVIIAVNKMDKPGANPEKVKSALSDLDLVPEEWGGDTIFVECSAKTGQGLKDLLETILVVAEVKDLKANPKKLATGTVIEAKLDKGRGPVSTLLVQNGTLRQGDSIVVGACYGKVRKMINDKGEEIKEALPSTPVEILGLDAVPVAGDNFKVFTDDKDARAVAAARAKTKIEKERNATSAMSLDDLSAQIEAGEIKEVPVIVKADVQGTAEAVASSLSKIDVDGVKVNIIRHSAGSISESDVILASVSKAVIYGFNVRPDANVRKKAAEEGVDIRLHNIIYKAVEEMEAAMKGMLAPVYEEVVTGQAEVRKTYKVSKVGTIAGCMVTEGKIVRNSKVRLIRNGIVIYTGVLGSLKRFENDAKEVVQGYECGMTIDGYNDIKEQDIIEGYVDQEVKQD
ncbi:MAG: translation initiation factor IF-2 [Solobacterium sp.]|nr:translation initiation factor IF-2 [Erysipelotrichaceae bacterium]MCI6700024.1 translation initiation factor IF-2 [Solobacterium sp.]MCI7732466.1 translation initiation factor IF-2 [Solobacterium sp.]MDD5842578.1 translation initiation factor IF-2 [Solobacterium sp.]MDD5982515.1 translation initiation factor IF-2 [Solobacterium sp.]